MLPLLGYFLATVLMLTGLFPYGEWPMITLCGSMLLGALFIRQRDAGMLYTSVVRVPAVAGASEVSLRQHVSYQYYVGICTVVLVNVCAWGIWADMSMLNMVSVSLWAMLCAAGLVRAGSGLLQVIAVIPVLAAYGQYVFSLCAGVSTHTLATFQMLTWTLAVWPFIVLLLPSSVFCVTGAEPSRRWWRRLTWLWSPLVGLCGLVCVVYFIGHSSYAVPMLSVADESLAETPTDGAAMRGFFWYVGTHFWLYSNYELSALQGALVLLTLAPVCLGAGARWRWMALCGMLLTVGPLFIIWICAPWYHGVPPLLWYVVYPALGFTVCGVIGMLCTVRPPDVLGETAIRAYAFGLACAAMNLVPVLQDIPHQSALEVVIATAVAPLLWALALAMVLWISSICAYRQQQAQTHIETQVKKTKKATFNMKLYLMSIGKEIYRDMRKKDGAWVNPSVYVPFLIFLSTIPVLSSMSRSAWICMCCVFASFLFVKILRHSLVLWLALHLGLVALSALAMGMHWLVTFSCVAPVLFVVWLFVRWPKLNISWVYVSSLLVLCLVHVPFVMLQGGDPMPALLLCAVLVLLCNGLQEGGARWLCLPIMSLTVMAYLSWWVYRSDPYVMIELSSHNNWAYLLRIANRIPILMCILYALMMSRQRIEGGRALWVTVNFAQRALLMVSMCLIVAWCMAWRPATSSAVMVLVVMALNYKSMYTYLRDCRADSIRWPLLDTLTLTLAAMIISAGEAYAFYLGNQRDTGTVSAGTLGVFIYAVKEDVFACVTTVIMVSVGLRLGVIRERMQRVLRFIKTLKPRKKEVAAADEDAGEKTA